MMIRSGFTWIKRWLVLLGKPSFRIVFFILTCLVLMVAVYIVYWVDPSQKPLTPACSFYHFTGLYCPGCGMTRALHNALHGRFGMAFSYNLLWPGIVFFIAVSFLMWFYWLITGKNPFLTWTRFVKLPSWLGWMIVIILFSFWVLRNIPLYPFTLLAP